MAECPGNYTINLKSGYWRTDNLSDIILPCRNKESNCLGGNSSFTCIEGAKGALCEICDLEKDFWPIKFGPSIEE